MKTVACSERNTKWCRVQFPHARRRGSGGRNHFGGSEWLKLCMEHANEYGEWAQSQMCGKMGRTDLKAEAWRNDQQVRMCPFQLERHEAGRWGGVEERKLHTGPSQSPDASADSASCEKPKRQGRSESNRSRLEEEDREWRRADGGSPPLTRVMNLQKRARKFNKDKADATQGLKRTKHDMAADSQSDRPSHHSREREQGCLAGSSTKLKPVPSPPTRRRSECDAHYIYGRQGGEGLGVPPGLRGKYGPHARIKATIRPMRFI